jgi:glyoxylate/hydroxypyruvate reductase A
MLKTLPKIPCTRIVDQFGGYISEYVFTYLLYIIKKTRRLSSPSRARHSASFLYKSFIII